MFLIPNILFVLVVIPVRRPTDRNLYHKDSFFRRNDNSQRISY